MAGIDTLAKLVNLSTTLQANKRAQQRHDRQQFVEEDIPIMAATNIAGTAPDGAFDPTNPMDRQMIFEEAGDELLPQLIGSYFAGGEPGTAASLAQMGMVGKGTQSPLSMLSSKDRSYLVSLFPDALNNPAVAQQALNFRNTNWEEYVDGLERYSSALTETKLKDLGADPNDPTGAYKVYNSKTGQIETVAGDPTTLEPELKPMSDANVQKFAAFRTMRDELNDLADIYNPAHIGFLDANARKLGQRFFDMPEFARMRQSIMKMIRLAYETSGKQLSDAERAYIVQAFLPQEGWAEENYQESILGLKRFLKRETGNWADIARAGRQFVPSVVDSWAKRGGREYSDDVLDRAYGSFARTGVEFKSEAEEQQAIDFWLKVHDYDPEKYIPPQEGE